MQHFQQTNNSKDRDNIFLLDRTSLQEYKLSLESSSNFTSNTLLQQTWQRNAELLDEDAVNHILGSAKELLQNQGISNTDTWESSLSKFTDPVTLLERSLPRNSVCKCDTRTVARSSNTTSGSWDDKPKYVPKFGKAKSITKTQLPKPDPVVNVSKDADINLNISKDIDLDKVEEENKAHKSNVAKLTFKTAKEQLFATNPAAKRALGASRKAQGKFVSPMLNAQEKQEPPEPVVTDERLKHIDPKMIELIESEIIDKGTPIGWDDIAGLQLAKSVIQEAVVWPLLRPDIFTGLRRPPRGILLFGPPGTGKTLIGRCVAAQCRATFFSISASSLTSKWLGDGEKMVRALFAVARCHQPAVIFIDEIDSLLTQRSDSEHEATRRIKTEFLVQFDGAATAEEDRLLVVGATNRPQELDEAARRRLVKRLYIPLPDVDARKQIITNLLRSESNDLSPQQVLEVARRTEGYSGADMRSLCAEAAMGPVRAVPLADIPTIDRNQVRPVNLQDFLNALQRVRPSVSQDDLGHYVKWNSTYGQGF